MKHEKHDIVYILKNNYTSEELKYSLRSVCENFPFRKIWFYGGRPEGIEPDEYVEITQAGDTKWDKVTYTLRKICSNSDITEDFWLFNDDFYVMRKVKHLEPMIGGTLQARIRRIASKHGGVDSKYSAQLRRTAEILANYKLDTLDYAMHVPILINRAKGLRTLDKFKGFPMFRSLYGNHHRIGGVVINDVKIQDCNQVPTGDEILLSTNDRSFRAGEVGRYLRDRFNTECRYERTEGSEVDTSMEETEA